MPIGSAEDTAMDFSDPTLLMSGFLISMIGLGAFMYGRRAEKLHCTAIGVVMMVYPMFVSSVLWMWIVGAACVGAIFTIRSE